MNRTRTVFKKVTHVIFDLDGTLLDSEPLYTEAAQIVLNKYGAKFTPDIKLSVLGCRGSEAAQKIVKLLNLPITSEDYYRMVKEQYPTILKKADLAPDTESIYKVAFSEIAQRYGKVYTTEVLSKIIGTPEMVGAQTAVTEMQLPIPAEQFLKDYKAIALKSFPTVGFLPGAEPLVRHFHQKHVPLAIATSSGKDTVDIKTERHKAFFDLFHHIVMGGSDSELKRGKPNPDIFLICASRFDDKPCPEQCLVIEDAPSGVQAAVSAGMQVVMVPDKAIPERLCELATLKLDSLENMKPELFGLPPLE